MERFISSKILYDLNLEIITKDSFYVSKFLTIMDICSIYTCTLYMYTSCMHTVLSKTVHILRRTLYNLTTTIGSLHYGNLIGYKSEMSSIISLKWISTSVGMRCLLFKTVLKENKKSARKLQRIGTCSKIGIVFPFYSFIILPTVCFWSLWKDLLWPLQGTFWWPVMTFT